MAEGRCREAWTHTSMVLALVANVNRDPKKTRPLRPADFNPYAAAKDEPIKVKDLSILKRVFVDKQKGES